MPIPARIKTLTPIRLLWGILWRSYNVTFGIFERTLEIGLPAPLDSNSINPRVRTLFVCYGNICRSPMAQGIFLQLLAQRGLLNEVFVDSAGTDHKMSVSGLIGGLVPVSEKGR